MQTKLVATAGLALVLSAPAAIAQSRIIVQEEPTVSRTIIVPAPAPQVVLPAPAPQIVVTRPAPGIAVNAVADPRDVIGAPATDSSGFTIGQVDDVQVYSDGLIVAAVHVATNDRTVAVPLRQLWLTTDGRAFLNASRVELERMPAWRPNTRQPASQMPVRVF